MAATVVQRFKGKRALVTGGSGSIGRGIAEALAAEGAEVWNFDLVESHSSTVRSVQVDLTDWETTEKYFDQIGDVDFLVNNAGIPHPFIDMVDIPREILDKVLEVNLKAPFHIGQLVAKKMIKAGKGGSIVNMSSLAAFCTAVQESVYFISKAGLQMMTKCMALELGPYNIRVNSVNPTIVTDAGMALQHIEDQQNIDSWKARTPLGRLAKINDVIAATLFLLSDEASLITGTAITLDGGYLVT